MARYRNIMETIGNTPLVQLNNLAPADVNVYVKVESFNPMGSVKDRLAFAIINDAEEAGDLQPGQTVVVTFELHTDDLAFYGRNMQRMIEPGQFHVWIGGSSETGLKTEFRIVAGE